MDCVFNTEERLRRRAASGLLLVLAVLVGWLSLADGPARAMSTTTVSAAIFTYDFPAVARVDAHELVAAEASPTQLSEVRMESASPSVQARGASTTSFRSVVATNTALQFADDGVLGFGSMSSFRRAYGSAGPNAQWHHVVEQTPGNVTQFGATSIHNTSNIVRLDTAIHRQVSGYYSSVQPFTSGQTVRQWLSSQPFDAQTQFGLDVLKQFGAAG